tara:strand:+ start:528 stop:761 length:234 start_codon:yes stop_codon:yes gene_type:complete
MFVYVGATDGKIELHVEKQRIGAAGTAAELALMFVANNITFGQSIQCSSSIDFCDEEGFKPGAAEMLVTEAIEMVAV